MSPTLTVVPAPDTPPRAAAVEPDAPYQILTPEGHLRDGESHLLSSDKLLAIFTNILRIRLLDERMITLQRQGRVGFYGACTGQEAAAVASAAALDPHDWIFPALREGAAMLLRGFALDHYVNQVFGNAGDLLKGRQMPSHYAAREVNQVSWSSCIGNQLPQAVGAAWAARLRGTGQVVMAYLGDGATSSADFHYALTFAGVMHAPVVFVCQNNHWSISVPTRRQTRSATLAVKAAGYGIPGVRVDGNDALAVYTRCHDAVRRARGGGGPTFIEAVTYRMGAHSTSDDPTRYRDPAEVEPWTHRDPLARLQRYLHDTGLLVESAQDALRQRLQAEIAAVVEACERLGPPARDTLFDDVYAALPRHLREQRAAFLAEPPEPPEPAEPATSAAAPH
jgi:pyruvate dehydrogenase E1 component alpha subunit/2-oxoisovalerate dehydrogenase E1 component alpha subunit